MSQTDTQITESVSEEYYINRSIEDIERTESEKRINCDHVCIYEGGRICYNDLGDKEVLKKIEQDPEVVSDGDSFEVDSLHSGESLFKTFTFDVDKDDVDLKKCMALWKSVLEKNVKPVKCSLLKKKQEKSPKEEPIREEKGDSEVEPCDSPANRKMWMNIYADLQKKKLDKLKLVKQKICDPCEDYIDDEYEKKKVAEDLKQLNDWTPKGSPNKGKLDVVSQIKSTSLILKQASKTKQGNISKEKMYKSHEKLVKKSPSKSKDKLLPKSQDKLLVKQGSSLRKNLDKTKSVEATPHKVISVQKRPQELESEVIIEIHDLHSGEINETLPKSNIEVNKEACCYCGCDINECICEDLNDIGINMQVESKICHKKEVKPEVTIPCQCSCQLVDCKCGKEPPSTACKCGCSFHDCICETLGEIGDVSCRCGCNIEECICMHDGRGAHVCSCGCGLEECICEDLFKKSCKCGHKDCDCDFIQILTTYLETLETPKSMTVEEASKIASIGSQTDGDKLWALEEDQLESHYCVICGHFNCFCNIEKPTNKFI